MIIGTNRRPQSWQVLEENDQLRDRQQSCRCHRERLGIGLVRSRVSSLRRRIVPVGPESGAAGAPPRTFEC
jgi:hypothetical protein